MSYRAGGIGGVPRIVCDHSSCSTQLAVVGRGVGGNIAPKWLHSGSPPGWKTIRDGLSRRDYCPQHRPESKP